MSNGSCPILDTINGSEDLKQISLDDLPTLCEEIRERIIQTVSRTGGHLAPSLGVVELTVAIHYVFDTPKDVLIWDVGHQAYAHKLLTGRRDRFHTLRQYGGISGFPRRYESAYDSFDTGHAGTSISAALGVAMALELREDSGKVIAVIGDGSMTAGLAFEGFNQAGDRDCDLIVILNDNEMSISPNVGALSSFLSRKLSGRHVVNFKKEVTAFLKSIPGIGENIVNIVKRSEESLKGFFTPGMLFEALKWDYIGPIRGHRLDDLIPTLENVKRLKGPVLVHVLTTKGKGYPPAEKDPTHYHGVSEFEVKTGRQVDKPNEAATYTEVFGSTLVELAQKDPSIFAITAAMPEGTGLSEFEKTFPDRFMDVGIAEQHAVSCAAGMATKKLIPVVAIYSTFLQRAYDQIIHDVCLPSLHVVFAMDRGGIVGTDGATHQGQFDLSFLRSIPNMVLMAPKDENELRCMLLTAVMHNGPIAIRYPRGHGVGAVLDEAISPIPIGQAEELVQGEDVLIIAVGNMAWPAVHAAQKAHALDIRAGVINLRFIKPLDEVLLNAAISKTANIITVEENVLQGGMGSAILEFMQQAGIRDKKVRRLGIPDEFVEHGSQRMLRSFYRLDEEGILQTLAEMVNGRQLTENSRRHAAFP
jgi:1-deoxy-D-xylulose-5-phosphate synthase